MCDVRRVACCSGAHCAKRTKLCPNNHIKHLQYGIESCAGDDVGFRRHVNLYACVCVCVYVCVYMCICIFIHSCMFLCTRVPLSHPTQHQPACHSPLPATGRSPNCHSAQTVGLSITNIIAVLGKQLKAALACCRPHGRVHNCGVVMQTWV